jgi:hypothetical protein
VAVQALTPHTNRGGGKDLRKLELRLLEAGEWDWAKGPAVKRQAARKAPARAAAASGVAAGGD